jgi:hypothetical protein
MQWDELRVIVSALRESARRGEALEQGASLSQPRCQRGGGCGGLRAPRGEGLWVCRLCCVVEGISRRLTMLRVRRAEVAQVIVDDCEALLDSIQRAQEAIHEQEVVIYMEEVAQIIEELDLLTESWV